MKKNLFVLVFFGFILVSACTDRKKNAKNTVNLTTEKAKFSPDSTTIRMDSVLAVKWTTNWRKYVLAHSKNSKDSLKYAFLVHDNELKKLLDFESNQDPKHLRAYLGMTDDNVLKIIFVGVDSNGYDLFNYSKGHYAYDFDYPCPTTCGNSPLSQ